MTKTGQLCKSEITVNNLKLLVFSTRMRLRGVYSSCFGGQNAVCRKQDSHRFYFWKNRTRASARPVFSKIEPLRVLFPANSILTTKTGRAHTSQSHPHRENKQIKVVHNLFGFIELSCLKKNRTAHLRKIRVKFSNCPVFFCRKKSEHLVNKFFS